MSKIKTLNSPRQVLFASLVGTTVEFFDFYIFSTAAALVFPKQFFPASNPAAAMLLSLATVGVAFFARPIGSAVFGHFGDRIGRKRTLVLALSTMGLSTFIIGVLPGYKTIGLAAPLLLALCRFFQGIGLGGEWGGAVLLAVENAPPNRRALYGMFPQLGAPIGFLCSGGIFLLLSRVLSNAQFLSFGWRLPFLASAVLVLLGLYVRLTITETPTFQAAQARNEHVAVPLGVVFSRHARTVVAGVLACVATFALFYLTTVFCLSWGTTALHFSRNQFLILQLISMLFFAIGIPISALAAEKGRKRLMIAITIAIAAFGFVMPRLFTTDTHSTMAMLAIGLFLMGLTYGPLGTLVSELFPTAVRYTGSSLAFSIGGVIGASATPYAAQYLAGHKGLPWVGYYLTAAALLTLIGLFMIPETKNLDLSVAAPID
ncbi:metabolite-proton symporter [Bryocella elongata]|uniref:Metabolite-proton symporter n=1 Tax=Bryocella elongata TaxID=863522 RepID=A0A1H5WX21_9BACT|nr:MFS transporter [Bryocella elongata]SEG04034.1 metabolite-proton symporter [Bryocella elongata]